jgi:hypothetical protein
MERRNPFYLPVNEGLNSIEKQGHGALSIGSHESEPRVSGPQPKSGAHFVLYYQILCSNSTGRLGRMSHAYG